MDRRVGVGAGNVLLCCVLLTRAEETAAWQLAGRILGWWLLGGLALFPVLGLTRALVVHLTTMIATPPALFTLVVLGAVR
ncbi:MULTISPECIES: hypothetical protein [Streptomyces]|uniref:Uncharacterized protein n=1 Tax=Streptomyces stelliscabiei TaxID=146820 RepID=A0A8I0P656_9ACTN|nr:MULTISPECIES: hypothetical protein [Streptomyces]MBE1597909.1 hypothetical protein [Streptomyces stelliscabiei]SOD76824.1 hypothetical protein SAMN06272781_4681 [Streptomyces sp. 1222.2]